MKKEVIEIEVKGTGEGVKEVEKLDKSIKNVGDTAKQSQKESEGLSKSAIDGAKNFKFMGVSINGVSKSLKFLKISLIATGIGAIVVAVGSLAAAFLSTQSGVDKLNSVLLPLKEILQSVWGIYQKLAEGLFQIVSGDVSKGFDTMAGAIENVGDQMKEAYERGLELHELQLRIRRNQIEEITAVTKLNIQRAQSLAIAEDTTKTVKERQDAYKLAIGSENAIASIKKAILKDRIKELELSQEANDTSSDEFKELVQLRADADQAEFDRITKITALTKRLNTVKSEAPEVVKEKEEKDKKEVVPIETQLANDQEIIDNADAIKELKDRETQDRIKGYREQIRQEELEAEIENEEKRIAVKQKALSDIISIVGAETAIGKAALIAKQILLAKELFLEIQKTITFSTQAAARSAVAVAEGTAQTAKIGFPQNIPMLIGYAVQAAGIIGAIKSAVKSSKASGISLPSTPSIPTSSISQPTTQQAQTPQFNVVGSSETNQLATSIGQQEQQPVQAYVVSNEVTTAQSLDRNIVESASFG